TPFENTQCRACPRGFFSSSNSSTKPCQPHQNCEQQGKVTNVQGNQYHDTLCTSCRLGRSNSTQGPALGDDDCEQAMIDFRPYLPPLKEGHYEVTKELRDALRAAKLHSIEEKVRERFLLY
ncbi:PREDICTED: tumor necrosis factor receptor superfamily member 6B-like, partial [Phaethon lepturus]|uniref:tumor necrosis factor receptor superfamily member 6B-like n=1 Tax=Phaethon lepturus TaxID=97097 RepID=UPI000530A778